MRARKSLRVIVPASIGVASLGAALVTPSLASAQDPTLPVVSRVQLVQNMLSAKPTPFSGTLVVTSNLFGSVSSLASSALPGVTLPQGTATVNLWRGLKDQLRAQLLNSTSERDLYVNGPNAWLWDSSTMSAVHLIASGSQPTEDSVPKDFSPTKLDPAVIAKDLLANLSPYVNVSIGQNNYVGGQPVYDLQLQPLDSSSLVRTINIYVDANNWRVVGVDVISTSSSVPVLSSEFSTISFSTPSASVFSFTPPEGAKVTTKVLTFPERNSTATESPATLSKKQLGSQMTERFLSSKGAEKPKLFGSGLTSVVVSAPGAFQSLQAEAGSKYRALFTQVFTSYQTPFGEGKVLSTPLFNVMVLPNGQIVAGAVTLNQLAIDATMGYQG
jgi:outer membrane lipoprotein-sorting protein